MPIFANLCGTQAENAIKTSKNRWILPAPLLLVIAGFNGACTTTPTVNCQVTDWQVQGERDAVRGRSFLLDDYMSQCANTQNTPDQEAYAAGYEAGLLVYCTTRRGLLVGKAGLQYANTCPPETAPLFLSAHRLGNEIRRLEMRLRQLKLEQSTIESQLSALSSGHPDRQKTNQRLFQNRNDQSRLAPRLTQLKIEERRILATYPTY
ncbi:MAG: DUF2799 domain-containing protein [Pseudomonadota bacterium]